VSADEATVPCRECGLPVIPHAEDSAWDDLGRWYHWACLQEAYERERLADGGDS
jgi:hypothetical protein